jgi:hypothetical protein
MSGKTTNTTPSQDAMLEHLAYLVLHENRPACWRDFQKFVVEGRLYSFKHGTIRNNLSRLRQLGLIEFSYRSIDAYHTLPGETNRKTTTVMTTYHPRVYKPDLAALIERMAFNISSAHDIHLRFTVPLIWKTLSVLIALPATTSAHNKETVALDKKANYTYSATTSSQALTIRSASKDLVAPVMALESGIQGRITIHKSDTVSVILSCSESPIKFNIGGLVRLTCSLARIEERLQSLIELAQKLQLQNLSLPLASSSAWRQRYATAAARIRSVNADRLVMLTVPECGSWIVTMWHIGFDSLECYAGEKFEVSWEDFTGEWIRIYSKDLVAGKPCVVNNKARAKKQRILRIERQEYPNDRLHNAVERKLSSIGTGTAASGWNIR